MPIVSASNYCAQESANTSNQVGTDGSCGLQYNGSYFFSGTWANSGAFDFRNTYDGNYSSSGTRNPSDGFMYINYTVPQYALNNSVWRAVLPDDVNYSVSQCINAGNGILQFKIEDFIGGRVEAYCWSGSSWYNYSKTQIGALITEESMYWNVLNATHGSSSYANNAYINVSYGNLQILSSELSTLNLSFYNSSGALRYVLNATTSNDTTFDISVVPEGYYLYNATATYSGVTANTSTRNLTIDRTLPTFSLNTSSDASNTYKSRAYLLINISAFDTNFANQTIYVINNSNSATIQSYYTINATQSLNMSITDGNYTYYSIAKDLSNNTAASSSYVVNIDTTAPTHAFIPNTDSNNTWVNHSYINMNSSITDTNFANQTVYLINTTSSVLLQSYYTTNATQYVNFTVGDGNYSVYVVANDLAVSQLNTSTTPRVVYVDATLPVHTFVTPSDSDNNYVNRNYTLVNSSFADSNFINQTIYLLNGSGSVINTYNTTNATQYVNFSALSDGTYQYYAVGLDIANNSVRSNTRTVLINTLTASITYNALTDADNQYTNKTWVNVNVTVNDVQFSNLTIYLYNSSGSLVSSQFASTATASKNFTGLTDGRYYFNVSSNNANSTTRTVSLSTTAPNIESVAYYVGGSLASCVQNSACSIQFTIVEAFCQDNLTTLFNVNATGGAPIVISGQLTKDSSNTALFPTSCVYSYSMSSNTVGVHNYFLGVTGRNGLYNSSSGNFTVVAAPASSSGGGGGGGSPIINLNAQTNTFAIKPVNSTVDVSRGSKRILEVQIDNTDNKRLTLQANIVQEQRLVAFDNNGLTVSLELLPASGIASASAYVRYNLAIPDNLPNGKYVVQIKFSSGDMSATHYLTINVTDSAFTSLLSTLQEPVFQQYALYQVLLAIAGVASVGIFVVNKVSKKAIRL